MHMRGLIPSGPRTPPPNEYKEYAEAFLRVEPQGTIVLFTDDFDYQKEVEDWGLGVKIQERIRGRVRDDRKGIYDVYPEMRHELNREVLEDIVLLSQCDFMLHGHSAVSESAIYINFKLHHSSINLAFPKGNRKWNVTEFEHKLNDVGHSSSQD
jgi:hypothetical protein